MSEKLELPDEVIEILTDHYGYMRRKYGDIIERYQQATGLKRVILAKRYPEVVEYASYLDAQQSVVDARRAGEAEASRIYII